MSRKRRSSIILESATERQNSLKAIEAAWDFGPNFTADTFQVVINKAAVTLKQYNDLIALLDDKSNEMDAIEKQLLQHSSDVLGAARLKHGSDSSLYEAAGGVRKSDRKKPVRKPKDK